MKFWDYGNSLYGHLILCSLQYFSLLEASRAGANVLQQDGVSFIYPSYVEDIMVF